MRKLLAGFLAVLMTVSVWGNTAFANSEHEEQQKIYSFAPVMEEKMGAASPSEDCLNDYVNIDMLKNYLFTQMALCNESIDVYDYKIPASTFYTLADFIFYEIPEAFHVQQVGGTQRGTYINSVDIEYVYSQSEFASMYQACEKATERLLAGIADNPSLTDVEKALLIHDRIAAKCEYDVSMSEENIYDMYGVLVKNRAVCQGYSEAYLFLLDLVGIDSYLCSSELLNHAWNIVYIDDVKYHVDVTWDDPTYDITGRVNHDNFLRSTEGIISTGHHKYGVTDFDISSVNTSYDDMFWQDSHTEFQLVNDEIFYIDNEANQLMKMTDGNDVVLHDVSDTWPASSSSHWEGNYSRLSSDGVNLFVSMQDAIYEYNLSTGASRIIHQPSLSNYYSIFGFTYKDGYLIYDLNNSPNFTSTTKENNQIKVLYDNTKPIAGISSTNNVDDRQQVTLSLNDNVGITGYYWGTSPNYSDNYFHTTSQTRTSVVVYIPGVYYLTVKDTSGNISDSVSMRFYKTTLFPQGGTVSGSDKQEIITPAGENFTAPIPVRSGYTFKGWSTDWNATSGTEVITPRNNASYYAVWESNDNEKPVGTIQTTNEVADRQQVTLSLSDNIGIAGYYWGTKGNYTENTYYPTNQTSLNIEVSAPGEYRLVVQDLAGNVSEPKTIQFFQTELNGNGGTISGNTTKTVLTASGNNFTVPTPTRTGYTFKGWAMSETATSGTSAITPSSDASYYAVWEFIDNEKPIASLSSTNEVADRQQVTLSMSDNIEIAGYYWGTSMNYLDNYFKATSQTRLNVVVFVPGTYYLTAIDTNGNISDTVSMRFYKTTLFPQGGSVSGSDRLEIITPAGENFTAPTPIREGYIFKGWSTDWEATSGIEVITPRNNASYYAVWEVIDNEKPTGTIQSTNEVADRQQVTLSLSDNIGIAGYYWGTKGNYTENTYYPTNQTSLNIEVSAPGEYRLVVQDLAGNVSEPKTIQFFQTELNGNGGTISGNATKTVLTANGFTASTPSHSGYTFKGWALSASATGGVSTITPSSDATYYAIWEKIIITETPVEQFVTRLYNICLNREPDSKGKEGWVNNLKNGSITGIRAAQGFIFSPEFKNKNYCNEDFVRQLYRAFMGREADAGGLANWVKNLNNGMTREAVFNGFALSNEFRNLCTEYGIKVGGAISVPKYGTIPTGCCTACGEEDGVTAFVKRLYSVCLDREADAGGLANWSKQLWNHTLSGRKVAYGFIFSKEFVNKNFSNEDFVEYLYMAFMGRKSDARGKAGWVRNLEHGMSRKQVFDGFAGSKEFTNICNQYGILRD